MSHLSPAQIKWWKRLDQLVREKNVKDQHGLQAVIRELALEVIAAQPEQDKIKVGDQTLRVFRKNQTKAEFIAYHRQNGRWGEDSLLFPLLEALGYQSFMHLANTGLYPYSPYEQTNLCGLKIDIVNYGAVRGGNHWELKGKRNPGDGNCMYYTVAQQVEKDMLFVSQELGLTGVASYKINAQTQSLNLKERFRNQLKPYLTQKEQAYFDERDKIEAAKEKEINTLLTAYSTDKLIAVYNALKHPVDGDTYLINRPKHSAKEQGNDFMQVALDTGYWDKDSKLLLREELIHALGKEAWRNPQAYDALLMASKNTQAVNQFGFFARKIPSCAAQAKEEFTSAPTAIPALV